MNPLENICQELQEYIQYEDNPCNLCALDESIEVLKMINK